MKFQAQETPYQYSISEEDKMPADDMKTPDKGNSPLPPDALAQIISGLMQTDLFKKLEEMINGMGDDKEGEQGDDSQAPPDEQQPPMPPEKPDGKEAAKYNEPAPVRFDASMAGANNTYIPSTSNKKEKYAMVDEDRVKYSKLENRANVLETEVKALKKLNDEIVLRYRKDAGNMLFKTLLSEGYELDKSDSDMLQNMLPENQLLHAEQIRRKYKKAPVTESDTLEEALKYSAETAPQGVTSQEEVEKVVELASKKGISYSDAKDELFGKAK